MSLSLVLIAYVAGLATVILGLCIRALWELREPRVQLPRAVASRLAKQLVASGAVVGNRRSK